MGKQVRIFQAGDYEEGQTLVISPGGSLHVASVLRMQVGEQCTLFCGDNREFSATILTIQKKKVTVMLNSVIHQNRESSRIIHLAQAISKGERMELVIQKAVELGVSSITPLLTTRCVVKTDAERLQKKQAQWHAIAIAACEQSGRNRLPLINPPCSLLHYLTNCQANLKLILHPQAASSWRDHLFSLGDIAVLIGPEGGFTEEEIGTAITRQFQPLRLGPRILRTETAAITILSVLQAIAGDL